MHVSPSLPRASLSQFGTDRNRLIGFGAGVLAVTVWAAWFVATRAAVTGALDPAGLAFLRFSVPALLLAPVWLRTGLVPRGVPPVALAGLVLGGAPYFVAVATGMRFAPAADAGTIIPGTTPLIVAALAVVLVRERIAASRRVGLALVAAGMVVVAAGSVTASGLAWVGHLMFLLAALFWALATLALQRAGLSLWQGPALLSIWSALMTAPLGIPALWHDAMAGAGREIAIQAVFQGAICGVAAFGLYVVAIRRLGASRAASFTALIPPMVILLAIPALGEWPAALTLAGAVATTLGVAFASGAIGWRARRP